MGYSTIRDSSKRFIKSLENAQRIRKYTKISPRHFSSLNIARGCNHLKAWTHPIKQQQQQCLESRLSRTSPALIQATSTSTMRLLLLLLGLANFICGHILQTNLINGSYRYKEGPYDGPLTGMDQYFAVWGVDSSVTDLYKANPYTETWILNEDGTGLTIAPISPGEEGADILKYQWGKEGDTPSPLGSILKTVITLAGPNTVRVVSKDEKAGITDVQIYRFTPAGAQKTSIATKMGNGSSPIQTAVWTSFEERIDEDGNPAPLSLPFNYFYF